MNKGAAGEIQSRFDQPTKIIDKLQRIESWRSMSEKAFMTVQKDLGNSLVNSGCTPSSHLATANIDF
jgi:hypothetical protein